MRLRKSDIVIIAVIAIFGLYVYKGFSNGGDFSDFSYAATASLRGLTDMLTNLMPDFSRMSW